MKRRVVSRTDYDTTGLVTNKVYADGKGPTYTYTPDGKLATRTWARGIVTTYSYDDNGALTNTVYSDGTPTISIAYNRAGRQIQAVDAAGVATFLYDDFGALTNETVVGVVGTNTIERFYDSFGRDAGYSLNGVRQSTLSYDPATGRLVTMEVPVSDGSSNNSPTPTPNSNFFTWNYLAGSDLKSSLSYPNGLTATWSYDANGQLLQVRNATPTNTISQYDYMYDAAGRRITVSKSGTAFDQNDSIAYDYNEKSELTNAVAAVDAAYRYSYDFDEIGNRESSSERGTNSVYAANNLNQYITISNFVSSVSFVANEFAPQFDDDGNQTLIKTATGIWQVQYNGENRPVQWTLLHSSTPNSSTPPLISMSYDRTGRRVTKNAQRFVYNGYLQIANFELQTSNIKLQTFIWDPTEPVATRPLVWNSSTSQPFNFSTSYYTHEVNKNVSEILSADGEIFAHYEYTPFGTVSDQCGELSSVNPWRFSSEFAEDDTATVYYNYRHYEPMVGRWLSRDPLGERSSLIGEDGLFVAFLNNPIGCIDILGLTVWYEPEQSVSCSKDSKGKTIKVENCTLNVKVGVRIKEFTNDLKSGIKWTDGKNGTKAQWKEKVRQAVANYFDNLSLKCYGKGRCCKICPDGFKVKVELVFDKLTGPSISVSNDPTRRSTTDGHKGPYGDVNFDRGKGEWDWGDADSQDKDGVSQIPVLHEIGHLLGLDHPRGDSNSSEAYDEDKNSLMGAGMEMRPSDFNKAFCSKINNLKIKGARLDLTMGCKWEAN